MNNSLHNQKGAVLIVALVLLLVITLLAVSSTRESSLETRMTGNFVSQQQQLNFAEGVMREGEAQMTFATLKPHEPNADANGACADGANYCFALKAPQYAQAFGDCKNSSTKGIKSSLLSTDATNTPQLRWYAIPIESDASNPEDGLTRGGVGTFRYEINVIARDPDTGTCTILRSTTVKEFN